MCCTCGIANTKFTLTLTHKCATEHSNQWYFTHAFSLHPLLQYPSLVHKQQLLHVEMKWRYVTTLYYVYWPTEWVHLFCENSSCSVLGEDQCSVQLHMPLQTSLPLQHWVVWPPIIGNGLIMHVHIHSIRRKICINVSLFRGFGDQSVLIRGGSQYIIIRGWLWGIVPCLGRSQGWLQVTRMHYTQTHVPCVFCFLCSVDHCIWECRQTT